MRKSNSDLRIEAELKRIQDRQLEIENTIMALRQQDDGLAMQEQMLLRVMGKVPDLASEPIEKPKRTRKHKVKKPPADPTPEPGSTVKYRCGSCNTDIPKPKMKGDIPVCPECGEPVEEIAMTR